MNQPIPEGYEGLIPHLVCDPCKDAIAFYQKAFDAEDLGQVVHPGNGKIMHAAMRIDGRVLFLCDDFPEFCANGEGSSPRALGGSPVTVHRYVENCDAAVDKAVKAGATVKMPPEDAFWGDRYAVVVDPFGHNWSLATHLRDVGDDEIQNAMSEMATA